jgi:mgtE-like transporter
MPALPRRDGARPDAPERAGPSGSGAGFDARLIRALGWIRFDRRIRGYLSDPTSRQSLVALLFNSSTSFVAGVVLGSIVGVFEGLPGLLVMVPAAIGLRGNISTAFGNRLSTSIHMGEFRMTMARGSVLRQNLEASFVLSAGMSVILAFIAHVGAVAVGIHGVAPVETLALVSITASLLSSLVVHTLTVGLAHMSVRRSWDLDNVIAPIDSTFGDVVTLPCLWLTSHLAHTAGHRAVGWALVVASLVFFASGFLTRDSILRSVTRQSWPILTVAIVLQTIAGLILESRLDALAVLPALLVLQPAFVSSAGALGGVLSSRLATKLHLGVALPTASPGPEARGDASLLFGLAVLVFAFDGIGAQIAASLGGLASPGVLPMLALSLGAGAIATILVMIVSYYSTVGAMLLRLDPDIYGVPTVTASADFTGSLVLILLAVAFVL